MLHTRRVRAILKTASRCRIHFGGTPVQHRRDHAPQVIRASGVIWPTGQSDPGSTPAHVPAKDSHPASVQLRGETYQQRTAMTAAQPMHEQRDSSIARPDIGTVIVNNDDVTIIQFHLPSHRAMLGQSRGPIRCRERLGVSTPQPPRWLKRRQLPEAERAIVDRAHFNSASFFAASALALVRTLSSVTLAPF